jgi:hypothetical protein
MAMVSLAFGVGFLYHNAPSDLTWAKGLTEQSRSAFLKDDGRACRELHYNYLELLYASILRYAYCSCLPPSSLQGRPKGATEATHNGHGAEPG